MWRYYIQFSVYLSHVTCMWYTLDGRLVVFHKEIVYGVNFGGEIGSFS